MKPIIIIIEDVSDEISKIKNLFSANYDFFPENQEVDNSFLCNVRDSIDNKSSNKETATHNVIKQLEGLSNKIVAFIIDYKLVDQDVKTEVITGLKFYQDFISIYYPSKPCIILTHLKNAKELNNIIDYIDKINNRNKLTFRLKQLDDSNFKASLKSFVKNANPVLQLLQKIKEKAIRNRNENLDKILIDIEKYYMQNYNDDIITVLSNFENLNYEINSDIQNDFIEQCNKCKTK